MKMSVIERLKPTIMATLAACMIAGLALFPQRAMALPSFARQTGLPCSRCHITFPELTEFGREFKLNGYTLSGPEFAKVTAPASGNEAGLWINRALPISAMLQIADTGMAKLQPGTQTGNVELPQQLSLFLAGEVATQAGLFLQVTYDSRDHFSLDNTDFRVVNFATVGDKPMTYGLDINNSPTVEDLWNDTPAWSWPFTGPDTSPTPAAATLVDGTLAQDVGGMGGYVMWNHQWYGDFTLYRSMHLGGPQPPTGVNYNVNIAGTAPYWRGAWQTSWGGGTSFLEVGTYGMRADSYFNGLVGPQDSYTDNAVDAQYEHHFGLNILTAHTTYIHEHRTLNGTFAAGGAASPASSLNTFRSDAIFHIGNRFGFGGGGFTLHGTSDSGLYPSGTAVAGSANNSPNSSGYTLQGMYWPVQNVEASLSYTGYTRFNGGTTNYDGLGRNARDNNTVFASIWIMF